MVNILFPVAQMQYCQGWIGYLLGEWADRLAAREKGIFPLIDRKAQHDMVKRTVYPLAVMNHPSIVGGSSQLLHFPAQMPMLKRFSNPVLKRQKALIKRDQPARWFVLTAPPQSACNGPTDQGAVSLLCLIHGGKGVFQREVFRTVGINPRNKRVDSVIEQLPAQPPLHKLCNRLLPTVSSPADEGLQQDPQFPFGREQRCGIGLLKRAGKSQQLATFHNKPFGCAAIRIQQLICEPCFLQKLVDFSIFQQKGIRAVLGEPPVAVF